MISETTIGAITAMFIAATIGGSICTYKYIEDNTSIEMAKAGYVQQVLYMSGSFGPEKNIVWVKSNQVDIELKK